MQQQFIKDFSQRILGIIQTMPNGDQVARAFPSREIKGFYKARSDHTTDFYGRVISRGNTLAALIYKQEK